MNRSSLKVQDRPPSEGGTRMSACVATITDKEVHSQGCIYVCQ